MSSPSSNNETTSSPSVPSVSETNSTSQSASNDSSSPPPPPPTTMTLAPPRPPDGGLATGALVGLIVGIGIGAILVLLGVCICVILRRKKRRRERDHDGLGNSSGVVPSQGSKDDEAMLPKPNPLPGIASKPQLSPLHVPTTTSPNSSSGSLQTYQSPSPGLSFGFSKSTFTYEELAMATDNFSQANLLGQGGFGYVHKGILPNGRVVAIKQLKAGSGQGEREFLAEVEIISRIHHRHLVSLVGYCVSGVQRMLVYEFVANNTLEFHLHGKGRPTMSWETRVRIALGSAKGLAYLHEDCQPKVIHRDIKASNILLDHKYEAKVADFGLAKLTSDADTHVSTRVMGTFGYIAPEYASSGKLTDKSDVFSFGVVLLELITGRRPVDRTQTFADSLLDWAKPLLTRALQDGNFDTIADPRLQQDYNTNEMGRMVACAAVCVRHSARRRPRMSQIVRALEGNISLENINEGITPGHSTVYSPYGSTDYDSTQYSEDIKKFQKMALETQENSTSEFSGVTSEYGLQPSGSSSEGKNTTQELDKGKTKDI